MWWLLQQNICDDMRDARVAGVQFTAEQVSGFRASATASISTVAGGTARIDVVGVLTNTPNIFAMYFGGGNTTYPAIIKALAEAEANPDVKNIEMRVNSGGGAVDGMFDAIAAMQTAKKPITAVVQNTAASAAFGLASQADTVRAHSKASAVGSIGVAVEAFVDDRVVALSSTNAPNKRPDLTTDAGKAVVVEQLDAVHDLFVDAIASGRGTSVKKVNAEFGRGSMLLADEALKRGMIDSVGQTALQSGDSANSNTAQRGEQQEVMTMDLNELRAAYPALCAQLVAEGREQGAAEERDRVSAHLTMGDASGDMQTAIAAVADGSDMTKSLTAKYLAAGMNKRDISARADDNVEDLDLDGTADDDETADAKAAAAILSAVYEKCGVAQEG